MIETRRTGDLLDANRRLAAQWARLRQANAFKSEILGTVAHDLKNPLAVILGRTEILNDMVAATGELDHNLQAQIKHIRASADRLAGMVDHLLAEAMADALDITIRREPVDIVLLVQEVAEANRSLAARKDQTIKVTAPPNGPVICDSDRVREAVDNLVSNAVKYSPIGGAIDLLVAQEDDSIMIEVRDHGAGLSPEDLSRMFGRFQRLSAKPTAGESSTGLGLSIVKRIVDLHGGRIKVESAGPGKGATFRISLPLTQAENGAIAPELELIDPDRSEVLFTETLPALVREVR
jgi:signal transduction histidine kinase